MLKSNIQQLELDTFDELAVPNSTVSEWRVFVCLYVFPVYLH